ncbi:hypothetical protein [Terricaulis silvestris]|uniref:Uncharacterized protein n=1 Tax=Terricaulis silvestris TaxID=2686094 RepID=A0A6I6MFP2_9CAUL|nr:hypothetical protein [Terricaulis silvestris]QGZ93290.1 hypothetical protein DSM104635_00099 [Terricaulis silvestris]
MSTYRVAERVVTLGGLFVNLPGMIILFGGWWLEFYFVERYEVQINLGPVLNVSVAVIALAMPLVLAWLWWSVTVPRWKIWALARCRDWPTLERVAIRDRLIWDERDWFGRAMARTEIWTPNLRKRFADLRRAGAAET